MPDFWIHVLGGELVLKDLGDSHWKNMLENNRETFNLGCQGPDPFFYNDFFPWIKNKRGPKIGTMLHETRTKTLLLESIDYLKKVQNQNNKDFKDLATYFLGFIVHYVVDKNEHPFIYARTTTSDEHKLFEMKLDTYFIKKYWNQKVHLLSPSSKIDIGKELPHGVVEYYKNIVPKVFGVELETDTINDSYNDYKKVFDIFYSPRGGKRFCLNMLNVIMPIDISICVYPTEVDNSVLSNEEFLEFDNTLKKAVCEGVKLINLITAYLKDEIEKSSIEEALHDISFSGRPTN
jgi:hypothetical protein